MTATAPAALAVTGLRKRFSGKPPVVAVDGVDLCVEQGSITAVLGASGCGKTTLLRLIAGLETPDEGTIALADRVVDGPTHVPAHRRGVGLVPQEGALFPHLSVADNVGFGLPRRSAGRTARIAELLELVDLVGLGDRAPHQLSGGQQQRVALARALAPSPTLVLLDEPFAALDAALRVTVRTEVAAVLRRSHATALLVTHDQAEALSMADQVAVMVAGSLRQVGTPSDLYLHPVDLDTARLVGELVTVAGTCADGTLTTAFGRSPVGSAVPDGPVTAGFRPEQLQPAPDGVRASVTTVAFGGPTVAVTLAVGGAVVTAQWSARDLPTVGSEVSVAPIGPPVAVVPAVA